MILPTQIKNLKAHTEVLSNDVDRLAKERDRLQIIHSEMSSDLERLLNNRQEMALVKRLVSAALKESKDTDIKRNRPGEPQDAVTERGDIDARWRGVISASVSSLKKERGDGPKGQKDLLEKSGDIFPGNADPDAPRPTVFTRPKSTIELN